jgi:hypothetical protein
MTPDRIRKTKELFRGNNPNIVKVTPQGFQIGSITVEHLEARINTWKAIKKYFDSQGALVCYSEDGISSSRGGRCKDCQQYFCNPRLKLSLTLNGRNALMELNYTSANNFISFIEEENIDEKTMPKLPVTMRVTNRGKWGEVHFTTRTRDGGEKNNPAE